MNCVYGTAEPLYDWSGLTFSTQQLQLLRHYQIMFQRLVTIYNHFCSLSSTATESGVQADKYYIITIIQVTMFIV